MKLTKQAISRIDRAAILQLCLALDFSELWVTKLVEQNKDNGPLTTAKAVQVIQEKTGLSDSEVLEESVEPSKIAS